MMVKYLAESPRVGQIVHFDAPMDHGQLSAHRSRVDDPTDHGSLIVENTMRRGRPGHRPGKLKEHVFLYRRPWRLKRPWRVAGPTTRRALPPRKKYVDYVAELLDGYRVGERTTVFWACPIDYDFPELSRLLKPDLVVADVIDDWREFLAPDAAERARATQNYRDVLGASDLVITNCRPLQERMAEYAEAIHLVPNASEPFSDPSEYPVPDEIRGLPVPSSATWATSPPGSTSISSSTWRSPDPTGSWFSWGPRTFRGPCFDSASTRTSTSSACGPTRKLVSTSPRLTWRWSPMPIRP